MSYEFFPHHETLIRRLAMSMWVVGVGSLVWAGLSVWVALGQSPPNWRYLAFGIAQAGIGMGTCAAAYQFGRVADSVGQDIEHLMAALNSLMWVYFAEALIVVSAVLLVVLAAILP